MLLEKIHLAGVAVHNLTMQETLDIIGQCIADGGPVHLGSINVDMIVRCNKDAGFAQYYKNCHLCLTDGVPILWASKFLGTPLKEKVAGSDLVPRLCALAQARGYKMFFLGGRPGAAAAAQAKLLKIFPELKIAGTYAPPFGFEKDPQELQKIEAMIKQVRPDILLVGLGAPKQEQWISQYCRRLGVPVMMGVGVTFEFIAGIVKRAPEWMQKSGLEWSWRLMMEPRRLWKRYLVEDTQFFGLVLKQKLNQHKKRLPLLKKADASFFKGGRMKKLIIFILMASAFSVPAWAQGTIATTYNWQFFGFYGGGTYPNVEFDPTVKNRVYLTSDVAGVWRSDNLGDSWYFINNGLGALTIPQIAIAPTNSSVLYVTSPSGVYYSLNAGQSWNASDTVNGTMTFERPQNYRSLAIDPTNPAHVCVGTQQQLVYCSSNYGQSWQNIPLPPFSFLQGQAQPIPSMFISRDASTLYVGLAQGVLEYSFSNNTWTNLGQFNDLTDMIEDKFLNRIYVASGNKVWYTQEYLPGSWVGSAPVPAGQVYRIALMHPTNTTVQVYVSWVSDGQGGVMAYQQQWSSWLGLDSNFYPDQLSDPTRQWASISTVQESLKVDPYNTNVLFRTDNWGVWRSDYSGYSWNEKIIGAPDTVASDIAVDAKGDVYVANMDAGLLESTDGGVSYHSLFPTVYADNTAGDVWRFALIGPTPRIVGTSSPWNVLTNQVIVSENGGLTFQVINNGLPSSRPAVNTMWGQGYPKALAVDPNNPQTIYMGIDGDDGGGLFVSNDGGYTWARTPGQPGALRVYHGLAVDPLDSNTIVWGAAGNNGGVYISKDKGKTFNYAETSMQWVFNLSIAPNGVIYAGGNQGAYATLYASDPTETNFTMLKQFSDGVGTAVDGIAINPKNPEMIAVSTVNWNNNAPCIFYLTTDGGKTWSQINGNLPAGAGAAEMTFDPQGQYLYIARYAGSVWRVNLGS